MNILFDASIMNGDFVGIAKSTWYLYDHCHRRCGDFHAYGFNTRRTQEYPEAGITLLGRKSKRELLALAREKDIRIVHYPANHITLPLLPELKTVLTVHDLIPYEDEHYFSSPLRKQWYLQRTRWELRHAAQVLTVSDYSRRSILAFSGGEVEPVPIHWSVTLPDVFPEAARPDSRYFLYVGGYDRRKGLDKLVRVYLGLRREGLTDCKLVLAGRPRPLDAETDALIRAGVGEGSIVQTGYVTDEELCALYAHAVCAVYLSAMEGFGLPVIEAMKYDCPIITTQKTSLPEIGGDAACYVDRDDAAALRALLLRMERDEAFREARVLAGRENLKRFDWDASARCFLRALEDVTEK